MAKTQYIPPEAAQIMKRMVAMPPKSHEDMKLKDSRAVRQTSEKPNKTTAAQKKKQKGV